MLPTVLFTLLLLAVAGGWMAWHVRAWRGARDETDERERRFQQRRFRRRMQASAMLAVAAISLSVGMAIPRDRFPSLFVYFWCGVMLLVCWLMALAIGDAIATNLHARRTRHEHRVEQAKLEAEMDRLLKERAATANGHAAESDNGRRESG
jgi:hypothetical protein